MIRVTFFGKLVDLAGCATLDLDPPDDELSVVDVIGIISDTHPQLSVELEKRSTRIVVNDVLDPANVTLRDGDELSFLPPVSGG